MQPIVLLILFVILVVLVEH